MRIRRTPRGWAIEWRDFFRQQHQCTFENENSARSYAAMIINQLAEQRMRSQALTAHMNISEALEIWLNPGTQPIRETSRVNYTWRLSHFSRAFGESELSQLRPLDIMRYLTTRNQKLRPPTFALEVEVLRRFFAWLESNHLIGVSPMQNIRAPHSPRSPGLCLTYQQEYRLLFQTTPHQMPKVLLGRDAGMRSTDIAQLRRGNLDFETQTISFRVSKTGFDLSLPMTARLADCLRQNFHDHAPDRLLYAIDGRPEREPAWFVNDLRKRLGFYFRFHDLRHSFFTRLQEACHDAMLSRYAMGHSIRVTADIYYHPSLENLRAAFQKMEEATLNALATYAVKETY